MMILIDLAAPQLGGDRMIVFAAPQLGGYGLRGLPLGRCFAYDLVLALAESWRRRSKIMAIEFRKEKFLVIILWDIWARGFPLREKEINLE